MNIKCSHLLALLLVVFLSSGCSSTKFKREWKKADLSDAQGMEGRWEGRWLSSKNGHTGKLRCIVQEQEDGTHRFHFYATYWKLFSGAYVSTFEVEGDKSPYAFSGEHELPNLFGGVYTYKGTATDTDFKATYECRIDQGTFNMTRVESPKK